MEGVSENMARQEPATRNPGARAQPEIAAAKVVSDYRVVRRSAAAIQLLGLIAILGIMAGSVVAATIGGGFGLVRKVGGVDPTANVQVTSASSAITAVTSAATP